MFVPAVQFASCFRWRRAMCAIKDQELPGNRGLWVPPVHRNCQKILADGTTFVQEMVVEGWLWLPLEQQADLADEQRKKITKADTLIFSQWRLFIYIIKWQNSYFENIFMSTKLGKMYFNPENYSLKRCLNVFFSCTFYMSFCPSTWSIIVRFLFCIYLLL